MPVNSSPYQDNNSYPRSKHHILYNSPPCHHHPFRPSTSVDGVNVINLHADTGYSTKSRKASTLESCLNQLKQELSTLQNQIDSLQKPTQTSLTQAKNNWKKIITIKSLPGNQSAFDLAQALPGISASTLQSINN